MVGAAGSSNQIVFSSISNAQAHGSASKVPWVPEHAAGVRGSSDAFYYRGYTSKRPLRVLIVGDSVAQTLGRGLELWAQHTGKAQVWNNATYYCSLARFALRIPAIGDPAPQPKQCDSWGTRWPQELRQFNPDVTIVLYTVWEMVLRKPPGAKDFIGPRTALYDDWQLGEYEKAVDTLTARGGKVVWLTAPCLRGSSAVGVSNYAYLNEHQIGAIARRRAASVRVVDLDREVCPGGKFRESYGNVEHARPDGAHFSDAGAEAVGDWLFSKILAR
jgi:hypothetical protein